MTATQGFPDWSRPAGSQGAVLIPTQNVVTTGANSFGSFYCGLWPQIAMIVSTVAGGGGGRRMQLEFFTDAALTKAAGTVDVHARAGFGIHAAVPTLAPYVRITLWTAGGDLGATLSVYVALQDKSDSIGASLGYVVPMFLAKNVAAVTTVTDHLETTVGKATLTLSTAAAVWDLVLQLVDYAGIVQGDLIHIASTSVTSPVIVPVSLSGYALEHVFTNGDAAPRAIRSTLTMQD